MKKWIILAAAVLLGTGLAAQPIRSCYRSDDISHISTEYESLLFPGNVPARIRVERAGFQDGSALYLLYLNLEQPQAVTAPKGAQLTAHLSGRSFVRLEQMSQDVRTRKRLDNGLYLNRFKYPVSEADMERLRQGISALEIVTGWGPDDLLTYRFPADTLGRILERHCQAIGQAVGRETVLEAKLAGYTDNEGSVLATAQPLVGKGAQFLYNIILSYLYYKQSDGEDIDLAFMIGTEEEHAIPYDTPVRFTLRDGSEITLGQTRDEVNFVYVYPSLEELHRMASAGIAALHITTADGTLEDHFPDPSADFSAALRQELELLLSVSPR